MWHFNEGVGSGNGQGLSGSSIVENRENARVARTLALNRTYYEGDTESCTDSFRDTDSEGGIYQIAEQDAVTLASLTDESEGNAAGRIPSHLTLPAFGTYLIPFDFQT